MKTRSEAPCVEVYFSRHCEPSLAATGNLFRDWTQDFAGILVFEMFISNDRAGLYEQHHTLPACMAWRNKATLHQSNRVLRQMKEHLQHDLFARFEK